MSSGNYHWEVILENGSMFQSMVFEIEDEDDKALQESALEKIYLNSDENAYFSFVTSKGSRVYFPKRVLDKSVAMLKKVELT